MDLKKYIEAMHRYHAREGYYPTLGHPQGQGEQESRDDEAPQQRRQRFIPRSRRRPWK